jgi:hypothetical protein
MNRQLKYYAQISWIVLDFFILSVIFLIFLSGEKVAPPIADPYVDFLLFIITCRRLTSFSIRIYGSNNIINLEFFSNRTVQVLLVFVMTVLYYLFCAGKPGISGIFIFLPFLNFPTGSFLNRFLYPGINYHFKTQHFILKKLILPVIMVQMESGGNMLKKKLYLSDETNAAGGLKKRVTGVWAHSIRQRFFNEGSVFDVDKKGRQEKLIFNLFLPDNIY